MWYQHCKDNIPTLETIATHIIISMYVQVFPQINVKKLVTYLFYVNVYRYDNESIVGDRAMVGHFASFVYMYDLYNIYIYMY